MKLTKQRNCRHCEPRSGVAIHASNGLDCHGLRPRDDENKTVNASRQNPDRYRTRTLNRVFVTASVARQSMQSRAWIATACGLAMTALVQGLRAVSGRIRLARNDDIFIDF
ncbi:MAG: hypothetical protein WAV14_11720 [Rhodoferax sp.]